MLERIRIGRTIDIPFDVTNRHTEEAVENLTGTARVYDADTGDAVGDEITMTLTLPDADEVPGRIWATLPADLALVQDQNIEVRASISGTNVSNEQQSAYFTAGRWE